MLQGYFFFKKHIEIEKLVCYIENQKREKKGGRLT